MHSLFHDVGAEEPFDNETVIRKAEQIQLT